MATLKLNNVPVITESGGVATVASALVQEGTGINSTGESGGTKFLREDGDATCSWQAVPAGTPSITDNGNANAMTIAADETITHVEMSTFSKIWQNPNTISANITIASGYSAAAAGPINFTGTLAINGNLSVI